MDYLEEIKEDVKNYIDENNIIITEDNKEEIEEQLNDDLWAEDSVTGNASGSYTFSTYQAEENIVHNLDLLQEALENFGYTDINILEKGAEWCDVTIRCYLLSQAISEVIEEIV
jgi:hypothetical protein